ncbi:MAG: cyclase family protein [Alphaproteobacteria bacterium]|nr:cyclase family protein [Alphaproteobacteria bacterium]
MSTSTRWKYRPPGSNWGDFGPDDQLGRMNLLTPEKVRQGMAEVKEGLTFNLSLPLDYPGGNVLNPRRMPPVLRPTVRNGQPNLNYKLMSDDPLCTDVVSDDLVVMHLQYSTQWDSLAHVGSMFDADGDGQAEAVYYNGWRAGVDVVGPASAEGAGIFDFAKVPRTSTSQAKALGIENMSARCVQGRAVMIDLHAHVGRERVVVDYDLLNHILQRDGVCVESGDMVCLHTGFADVLLDMQKSPVAEVLDQSCAVLEGRDPKLLQWITDSGLAALIADNYAVEAHPATHRDGPCPTLPLHEHCLFKLGVHLGEIWHLGPLAHWLRDRGRHRFLLTAPPLRLPGAVGSPATPIATV